jgi:hypothetical protein
MPGRECYHCQQWIEQGEAHNCWTTTEAALTQDLPDDLRDARQTCYFFVRPRRSHLQVCVFLGRAIRAPQVRRAERRSTTKFVNILHITHRDEVEAPITEWLREAYELSDQLIARGRSSKSKRTRKTRRRSKRR